MHVNSLCVMPIIILFLDNTNQTVYTVHIQLILMKGRILFMIKLSNASDKPIYEQITEQLKQAILSGTLLPGDALPSIRMLAKELKISVMTTKRAYSDLERDGFIETVAGKGSFVAQRNQDFLKDALVRQVEDHLIKAAGLARTAGMSHCELLELMKLLLEDEEK